MECYVHPDQNAVGACVACGNFVCDTCRVSMEGKIYCKACVEKGAANPPPPRYSPPPPQSGGSSSGSFTRSRTDKVVAGLCGGLAPQFSMDANILRVLVALAVFFTGIFPGAVIYAVLWAVIPEE